jgi:hypothetical protein
MDDPPYCERVSATGGLWGITTRRARRRPQGSAVDSLYGSGGRRHRPLMGTLRHSTLAALIEASPDARTHE